MLLARRAGELFDVELGQLDEEFTAAPLGQTGVVDAVVPQPGLDGLGVDELATGVEMLSDSMTVAIR